MKTPVRMTLIVAVFVIAGAGLALFEINRSVMEPPAEDSFQKLTRWRKEAPAELTNTCSKETVGFTRITDSFVNDSSANPSQWTGRADVEYVNKVGGIDRTNLILKFYMVGSHVYCIVDGVAMFQREMAAH